MPEKKNPAEPLDDATLKQIVGGATDEEIENNCPPPPPPSANMSEGTGN